MSECQDKVNKHREQARRVTGVSGLLLCLDAGGVRNPDGEGEGPARRFLHVRKETMLHSRADARKDWKARRCGRRCRFFQMPKASSAGAEAPEFF